MDVGPGRESITAEAVSAFSELHAIGCSDGSVHLAYLHGNFPATVLYWHRLPVLGLSFSVSNGTPILASAGADKCTVFWRPKRGKWRLLHHLDFDHECTSVAFSSIGHSVAIALSNGFVSIREAFNDFAELESLSVGHPPAKVAYFASTGNLLFGHRNGALSLYSEGSLSANWRKVGENEVVAIAISKSDYICVVTADAAVRIIHGDELTELAINAQLRPVSCRWDDVTGAIYIIGEFNECVKFFQMGNRRWREIE
jgi:WD40 repeat protein